MMENNIHELARETNTRICGHGNSAGGQPILELKKKASSLIFSSDHYCISPLIRTQQVHSIMNSISSVLGLHLLSSLSPSRDKREALRLWRFPKCSVLNTLLQCVTQIGLHNQAILLRAQLCFFQFSFLSPPLHLNRQSSLPEYLTTYLIALKGKSSTVQKLWSNTVVSLDVDFEFSRKISTCMVLFHTCVTTNFLSICLTPSPLHLYTLSCTISFLIKILNTTNYEHCFSLEPLFQNLLPVVIPLWFSSHTDQKQSLSVLFWKEKIWWIVRSKLAISN